MVLPKGINIHFRISVDLYQFKFLIFQHGGSDLTNVYTCTFARYPK